MVSIFPQRRTDESEVSQSFALGPLEHVCHASGVADRFV